jgi:hypothetical protein
VAAGFLDWHDAQRDKAISSPLVLIPVELRRESTRDPYRLFFVEDEEIVINPSLTEKLRHDAGLDVPGDWAWEDKPIARELDEIRQAVDGTGWTVREQAVIGLFSFQKYVMYRDLLDHETKLAGHPIVRSLAHGRLLTELRERDPDVPEPAELDDVQEPGRTLSILDADASQRQCIEAAKRGRSFVMQGPPGTGKSQTIANVIAEAIGQGKRVLFVSEKAAALDVVHKRLAASGLDEYCLMLHGEHAGRREVVQTLDRSLTSALQARPGMRGDELERLANLRTLLNGSAESLHLSQPLLGGRTLREVHEQLAKLHRAPSIAGAAKPSAARGVDVLDESQALTEVFQRLGERWHVSPSEFDWRGYKGTRFTADDRGHVLAVLRELSEAATTLGEDVGPVADAAGWPRPTSLHAAERLAELGAHLEQAPDLEPHWLDIGAQPLRDALHAARNAFDHAAMLAEDFAGTFPSRSWHDFPADAATQFSNARETVRWECGWSPAWDEQLSALPAALDALSRLPGHIETVSARATDAAALVGQPATAITAERLEELAELADLAFTAESRPERIWLVRAGLTRAKEALASVADDLRTFQEQRARLRERYTDAVLDLDSAELRGRFATQYTSLLSKLSSAYRRDARAIKEVSKTGKLADSLLDDLELAATAREHAARIDAQAAAMERALGSYARGRDTDPDATGRAIAIAERIVALSHADAGVDALANAVAVGSTPDPASAHAADRLRDALTVLTKTLPALELFIASPPRLFAGDLQQLAQHLATVEPALTAFADLANELDTGAVENAASLAEVERRATLISDLHRTESAISRERDSWKHAIGGRFADRDTPWPDLQSAADWIERVDELAAGSLPDRLRERLLADERAWPSFADVEAGTERMARALAAFSTLFDSDRAAQLRVRGHQDAFSEIRAVCERLADRVDELRDWTEWRQWRTRAAHRGWDRFVESLIDARIDDSDVLPAFQRAYWNRRLEAFYDDDPELAEDLRGGAFQRWVDEFCALDRRLVQSGADRLIARRERDRPGHVSARGSEVELLRREARKMRRHLPVRVLLSKIPTLLSELKPCLMMSPLTVSSFLSADHAFDLVLFDEASQVPPQDAVNCIYRGAQLVVAGDSKQLPPTPFFQIAELDELAPEDEDASTEEDMESVLDACDALLPSHSLNWHYRSRSEPLIAFSNRHIYEDRLVTFPSAEHRSSARGIEFIHVPDGVYDRGRAANNRIEARVVARRVMERLTDGSKRSVGVIAFNTSQANAIAEELDLLKAQRPELEERFRGDRLDAVFVKHLEAVQGDERDVIIFSVGYGRDAGDRFTMNFGPLNKDGGQRRLNVAVTRAREKVELVASVRARDFRLADGASAGARLLRDYLAYAEAGGRFSAEWHSAEVEAWPSALEEEVGIVLRELGYDAVPNVGVGSFRIDIGVRSPDDPDTYILGIECDGEGYAQTATARDRERLRHEVLDQLGWGPIHRIWSLDWVQNRVGELERLRTALEQASARGESQRRGRLQPTPPTPDEDPRERITREIPELDSAAAAAELPWTVHYRRTEIGSVNSFYDFHESVNRRQQTDMLLELVAVEAPVSIDYAIRRLADAFGYGRVGHRVANAGRQAISQASRRGGLQIRGEFLWRPGQTLTAVRIPDPYDERTRRDIDDIPPEEIDLAIARLDEASAGSDDEQLLTQVARVLGFDRTGGRIRAVLGPRVKAHRLTRQ